MYLCDQGFEVDEIFGLSKEELVKTIPEYDALIVRSATKVTRDIVEQASNLKVVGRAGNGIDNIDVAACTDRGVVVVNTPTANTMAAAELSVALAFAVFRDICQAHASAKQKDYRRAKFVGFELDGKTAGVIGLGRIGSIVARKLKGVGMDIIAYDPYISAEAFDRVGAKRCQTLDELLAEADLITIHMPKTKESYNMIDAPQLEKCKQGVRIVNVARGGMVNEKALSEALKSGHVAGAALDVLDKEPNFELSPDEQDYENQLLALPNVIYTPHLGASTHEAKTNVGVAVTELVSLVLKGELVEAINMPSVSGNMAVLKPFASLCEKLGKVYFQAETKPVKRIEIVYRGELAKQDTGILTLSVLKGFMSSISSEPISFVNVKKMVEDRGVEVIESKTTQIDRYNNLVHVKFITEEDRELSVDGTIFGVNTEVMVTFFGYHMNFELASNILAMQNEDRPGIIGKIASILGENQINIGSMHWGRKPGSGKAQAFVAIDQMVTDDVIDSIAKIDGVLRVSHLEFN